MNFPKEAIGDPSVGVIFAAYDAVSRAATLAIYFLKGCPDAVEQ